MADRLGEVRTVKGANCEEDIGLAAEAVLRAENGPCVVFDDIPGCPKGFRLLLNIFAGARRNMTFGFPGVPASTIINLYDEIFTNLNTAGFGVSYSSSMQQFVVSWDAGTAVNAFLTGSVASISALH